MQSIDDVFLVGDIKKHWNIVFGELRPRLLRLSEDAVITKKLGQELMNDLIGVKKNYGVRLVESSLQEKFVGEVLYRPLTEIMASFEAIRCIPIYLKRTPYSAYGVPTSTYIRYHIENYLNEMYLLKSRLVAHARRVSKSYKKSTNYLQKKKILDQLIGSVENALEPYVHVRDYHVHESRYHDFDLRRLSVFELLSQDSFWEGMPDSGTFRDLVGKVHRQAIVGVKKKWQALIQKELKDLVLFLQFYFHQMDKAIAPNSSLEFPSQT